MRWDLYWNWWNNAHFLLFGPIVWKSEPSDRRESRAMHACMVLRVAVCLQGQIESVPAIRVLQCTCLRLTHEYVIPPSYKQHAFHEVDRIAPLQRSFLNFTEQSRDPFIFLAVSWNIFTCLLIVLGAILDNALAMHLHTDSPTSRIDDTPQKSCSKSKEMFWKEYNIYEPFSSLSIYHRSLLLIMSASLIDKHSI